MNFRWVLYIISLVVFVLFRYFKVAAPDSAQRFYDLWIFAFIVICGDAISRTWPSKYVFFPLGYAGIFLYLYFGGPYTGEAHTLGSILHLALGIMLLIRRFRMDVKEPESRLFLLVAGIVAVIFGFQFLTWFEGFKALEGFYHLNLTSYLLLAAGGRFLLSNIAGAFLPDLKGIVPMLMLYHGFLIVEQLMRNFVL